MDRATRDAWDRGAAVKEAGFQWTSFGQYGMRHAGPKVVGKGEGVWVVNVRRPVVAGEEKTTLGFGITVAGTWKP